MHLSFVESMVYDENAGSARDSGSLPAIAQSMQVRESFTNSWYD